MRNPTHRHDQSAPRPGDRTGAAGEPTPTEVLATEVIRLARLATSLHLAEQARLLAAAAPEGDREAAPRQPSPEPEPVA